MKFWMAVIEIIDRGTNLGGEKLSLVVGKFSARQLFTHVPEVGRGVRSSRKVGTTGAEPSISAERAAILGATSSRSSRCSGVSSSSCSAWHIWLSICTASRNARKLTIAPIKGCPPDSRSSVRASRSTAWASSITPRTDSSGHIGQSAGIGGRQSRSVDCKPWGCAPLRKRRDAAPRGGVARPALADLDGPERQL